MSEKARLVIGVIVVAVTLSCLPTVWPKIAATAAIWLWQRGYISADVAPDVGTAIAWLPFWLIVASVFAVWWFMRPWKTRGI